MATRSEKAAKIAGGLVAVLGLGALIYRSLRPLLDGEDPWLIATVAGGIVLSLALVIFTIAHIRRRQIARHIRRRGP